MKKLRNTPRIIDKVTADNAEGGVDAKIEEKEMERGVFEEEEYMVKE